jgi:hypothetical protein
VVAKGFKDRREHVSKRIADRILVVPELYGILFVAMNT